MAKQVVIGLTGLSQSGKTTFIASAVHMLTNLEGADRNNRYTKPFFEKDTSGLFAKNIGFFADKRVVEVKVSKKDARSGDRITFPNQDVLDALTGEGAYEAGGPCWPTRTKKLSEIEIQITYRPEKASWTNFSTNPQSMSILIVDYPGEWMADLMLLSMTYGEWCEYCREFFRQMSLTTHSDAREWVRLNEQEDPAREISGAQELNCLAKPYERLLKQLHDEDAAQSMLSPGRLISPDGMPIGEKVMFFPLLGAGPGTFEEKNLTEDSLFSRLENRYEGYKREVVQKFVNDNFAHVTDQIVLVDCVRAVEEGADAVKSLERGVQLMQKAIRETNRSLMMRLWSWISLSHSLKRIHFVATKADLVIDGDRGRLKDLMQRFGDKVVVESGQGGDSSFHAVAAVKTTKPSWVHAGRERVPTLAGLLKDNKSSGTADDRPSPVKKQVVQRRVYLTDAEIEQHKGKKFCRFDNPGRDRKNGNLLPSLGVAELLNGILKKAV